MYTGEKVRLREYRKEDIPQALAYVNDPEVKRLLNPNIPYPLTLSDEEKWVAEQSASSQAADSFAIETLADGKYIGGCGINSVNWKNSTAEVGIFIGDQAF